MSLLPVNLPGVDIYTVRNHLLEKFHEACFFYFFRFIPFAMPHPTVAHTLLPADLKECLNTPRALHA